MQSPAESITHGSRLPPNRRWVAAAFLMGLIFPIVPGLLIAARSTDPWVRREAQRAAQYQAVVLVIASIGTALLQMGRSMSAAAASMFHSAGASALFSAAISAVAHSPAGTLLFLAGGLLSGIALAGWWVGMVLAAIGGMRGDSLGLPRFRARRSQL